MRMLVWTGWAGALFLAKKKISIFFQKNNFPGVFKWFLLHKKVSLTTLAPSGRPSGVSHGLSRAPGGQQNCIRTLEHQNPLKGLVRSEMAPGGPRLAHKTPAQTKNSLFGPGPEILGQKFFFTQNFFFFQENIRCVPKGSGGLKNPNLALGTPGSPILAENGQNGQNRQKWPKMAQNHQKLTFFDFQSVYTQNDRNFALILNLSLIFEKNGPKWPKMAKYGPKSPKNDFFLTFKVFILKMTAILP